VTAVDGLRIRASASSSSGMVGSLAYGQNVQLTGKVVGESINGNTAWFRVSSGYASGYFLNLSGGASWCN